MNPERLLERMRSTEGEPPQRGGGGQRRAIASVLSHLQRILNTRQGNVPIAADYGVPDFLDFLQSYPESVRQIEQSIRNAIDKYEPRLSHAAVTFVPDDDDALTLRFQIVARLTEKGERTPRVSDRSDGQILFESVITSDGRIRLQR